MKLKSKVFAVAVLSFFLTACDQLGGRGEGLSDSWTWIAGNSSPNQTGTYGTLGVASSGTPGGRTRGATWTDASGHLWLFGGYGLSSQNSSTELNDFWKFNGSEWIWMGGNSSGSVKGTYGAIGEKSLSFIPGSRAGASYGRDKAGNFYLFGGNGYDRDFRKGRLNDLWKFDGTYWIYLGGSSTVDQTGSHGLLGVPALTNVPGSREDASFWVDGNGTPWMFGGYGLDKAGRLGRLNDLWKFESGAWVHMAGHTTADQRSNYGTKGTAALTFTPGGRYGSLAWVDTINNTLYLYGGTGYSDANNSGTLSDVWKYNSQGWAWADGSHAIDAVTDYSSGFPGGRSGSASWQKGTSLILFGGEGSLRENNLPERGSLSDIWSYSVVWTHVTGPKNVGTAGTYGTLGVRASGNQPGARSQAMTWVGNDSALYMFGGMGYGASSHGLLNDLWKN